VNFSSCYKVLVAGAISSQKASAWLDSISTNLLEDSRITEANYVNVAQETPDYGEISSHDAVLVIFEP
jgi:hypothetical protein